MPPDGRRQPRPPPRSTVPRCRARQSRPANPQASAKRIVEDLLELARQRLGVGTELRRVGNRHDGILAIGIAIDARQSTA